MTPKTCMNHSSTLPNILCRAQMIWSSIPAWVNKTPFFFWPLSLINYLHFKRAPRMATNSSHTHKFHEINLSVILVFRSFGRSFGSSKQQASLVTGDKNKKLPKSLRNALESPKIEEKKIQLEPTNSLSWIIKIRQMSNEGPLVGPARVWIIYWYCYTFTFSSSSHPIPSYSDE